MSANHTEAIAGQAANQVSDNNAQEAALTDQLIAITQQRNETYRLLACLFRQEMDRKTLTELHESLFPVSTGNAKVDRGYKRIATYLSNIWNGTLEELRVDYARTFLSSGNDAFGSAYPFESVYTSEKRLLMQDARFEVLAIYRAAGIDKKDSWREGEDHLSLELEFECIIGTRALDALKHGDDEAARHWMVLQRNFLEKHLCTWVGMFAADVRRLSQTDFYKGAADVVEGFVESDKAFLDELLDDSAQA